MALPDSRALAMVSQSRRRATGSMPVDGSSRKMTAGSPSRAMPVFSFCLLPLLGPEEEKGGVNGNHQSPVVQPFSPFLLC